MKRCRAASVFGRTEMPFRERLRQVAREANVAAVLKE